MFNSRSARSSPARPENEPNGRAFMSVESLVPATYEKWRECIEIKCRLPLTKAFISERLAELSDRNHPKTRVFEKLYGAAQRGQTVAWLERAAEEAR